MRWHALQEVCWFVVSSRAPMAPSIPPRASLGWHVNCEISSVRRFLTAPLFDMGPRGTANLPAPEAAEYAELMARGNKLLKKAKEVARRIEQRCRDALRTNPDEGKRPPSAPA
jgi:hypothetical protein